MGKRGLAVVGLVLAGLVSGAWGVTVDDLCSSAADPCIISTSVALPGGTTLDLGARGLKLAATAVVSIPAGTVIINAGSFTMLPGAVINAVGSPSAGNVLIRTLGAIDIKGSGSTQARILASSNGDAGLIDLVSAEGAITVEGEVLAVGTSLDADGGIIHLRADGNITAVNGEFSVSSGDQGTGGEITMNSVHGSIDLTQELDAAGGDGGGGTLDLDAGVDLVTRGKLDVAGGGFAGDGGFVRLDAVGSVQMLGPMVGTSVGTAVGGGGSGADLEITATTGDVLLSGAVTNSGGAPDGTGGSITIVAGHDVTQTGQLIATGPGTEGCGGSFDLTAGNNLRVDRLDASGGSCGAGNITLQAGGSLTSQGQVIADSPESGFGAWITYQATALAVSSVVRTSGPLGNVVLRACTIGVTSSGLVKAFGDGATTLLQASGQMTLQGTVSSSTSGSVRLDYLDPTKPPLYNANLITPLPMVALNAGLAPCPSVNTTTTVVTTTTTASTTTTTRPGELSFATTGSRTGCFLEWKVRNPGGTPTQGVPDTTQTCIDGDPACDLDGTSDGTCIFAVSACLGVTDPRLPLCQPTSIDAVNLDRPTTITPDDAIETANASALVTELRALGMKLSSHGTVLQTGTALHGRDRCTAAVGMRVPHAPGVIGKRSLTANGIGNGRQRQRRNPVTLVCAPNPAVCGNGVPELGEACDDGNLQDCDGCSSTCQPQGCGDGVLGCGEQCDDGGGNGAPGASCTAQCTFAPPALRIPGGGKPLNDCALQYALRFGTPALDHFGLPAYKQTCVDNDPACDVDPTVGNCRVRTWLCAGAAEQRLNCPATTVSAVTLVKPTYGPIGRAVGTILLDFAMPSGPGETCSPAFEMDVPMGGKGIALKTSAQIVGMSADRDQLKIRCAMTAPKVRR